MEEPGCRGLTALQGGSFDKLFEVDETFIGGKARNMHISKRQRRITGTYGKDKTAVVGILGAAVKFAAV